MSRTPLGKGEAKVENMCLVMTFTEGEVFAVAEWNSRSESLLHVSRQYCVTTRSRNCNKIVTLSIVNRTSDY